MRPLGLFWGGGTNNSRKAFAVEVRDVGRILGEGYE